MTYYNMYDHKSEKIKMQHRYGVVQQILTKIHLQNGRTKKKDKRYAVTHINEKKTRDHTTIVKTQK